MPIIVEVIGKRATKEILEEVFAYFTAVDERFSTYKKGSEIMQINRGELPERMWSPDMRTIFVLAEKTRQETKGYFNIKRPDGSLDPSGVVKGWAIARAAELLRVHGCTNFYINAGGDIQSEGRNEAGKEWSVGIRNPFDREEIVKVIYPRGNGVATSGTAERGEHIYNPHMPDEPIKGVVSITLIGPDVCEADRFATAAFAMGGEGIHFVEGLAGFEAYAIDARGIATMTTGFETYQTV